MQLQNLSPKIIKYIRKQGFREIKLNPVIETKYIRGVNLKKYLFTFNDDKGVSFSLRPDLSLMSLIQFSKTKNKKKRKFFIKASRIEKINTFFLRLDGKSIIPITKLMILRC